MSSLQELLNDINQQSRIEAIEASVNGSGIAQSNHRVKFKGYTSKGRSVVEVDGKYIIANSTSSTTPRLNQEVLLRTGKGIRTISF